jgi:hypothetical protein
VEAFGTETFYIDTELTRAAIKAGVWSRVCCELADREEDATWRPEIEPLATTRGQDASTVLARLESTEIDYLADARRRALVVEEAPLSSKIELEDVWRFMPRAWDESANRWLWAPSEMEDVERQGDRVVRVREFGSDEGLRGD